VKLYRVECDGRGAEQISIDEDATEKTTGPRDVPGPELWKF
jgi:hypothetical protein